MCVIGPRTASTIWAVSDINAGELDEFCQKFKAALHPSGAPS